MKSIEAQSIRGLRLWYLSKKLDAIFFIHFFPVFRVRCNFNDQIVFLFFAEEKDQPAVAFRSFLLTDAFTFFTPDTSFVRVLSLQSPPLQLSNLHYLRILLRKRTEWLPFFELLFC